MKVFSSCCVAHEESPRLLAWIRPAQRNMMKLVRSGNSWMDCPLRLTRLVLIFWRQAVRSPIIGSSMLGGEQNSWIGGESGSSAMRSPLPQHFHLLLRGLRRSTRHLLISYEPVHCSLVKLFLKNSFGKWRNTSAPSWLLVESIGTWL